ncbi:MAG: cytochrome b/b6 domain-containing protein [Actinomycetota bacterium]
MLAQFNIWADVLALGMVILATLFWIFQLFGNAVTGRFKQKFRFGQWPEHDEIIPVVPRLMHFAHVFTLIFLAVSGLYIRFPFYPGMRPLNEQIHFIAYYAILIILVIRIVYAIFVDHREFAIRKKDLKAGAQAILYYMFLRRQYPHLSKYNALQKIIYGYIFPVIIVLMAITGFAMQYPNAMLGWASSVDLAAAYARVSHFFLGAIIVFLVLIHICLSFVEDFPALMIFFGLRRQYWEEDYEDYYEDEEYYEPENPEAPPAEGQPVKGE